MSLTLKQKLFVVHLLGKANGNATLAARMAGYAGSDSTLRPLASRLQRNATIRAAIEAKVAAAAMPADEVLLRMTEIAVGDLLDFLNLDPESTELVSTATLRRAKRRGKGHLLKRLKVRDGDIDIDLESKYAALKLLGEYHGLWDRERPPEVSMVELAKKFKAWLKEKHD